MVSCRPRGALDSLGWLVRKDSLWVHRLSAWPLEAWTPGNDWRFVSLGIRAFKADRRFGERPAGWSAVADSGTRSRRRGPPGSGPCSS